ncbi:hypothetical protein SAMN03097699_3220 [Flavobacteriaceae bacterium MAR_2010_188]|nr:hypothetical protein SAMN03097699_3220 [Flavobacteriaceae bacterium MAR_2010_188]
MPVSELQIYVSESATDPEIETAANKLVFDKKLVDSLIKSYKETNPQVRNALVRDLTENNWSNQFEIFTKLKIPKFIIAGSHDI